MAITSTSGSGTSGSTLDVASIVSQLMAVEQKPLTALDTRIDKSTVKISALASFQSKLSLFKGALDELQNPGSYTTRSISSSVPTIATAATTDGVVPETGRYNLKVTQVATAALTNVEGFNSSTDALVGEDFSVTVGNTPPYRPPSNTVTTLRGLSDWINSQAGLKDAVQATLIKQNDNSWVLSIQGRNTGAAQAITVSAPAQKTVTAVQAAQDARFTMNGIEFSRSTNVVSDAISGLTLNLLSSAGTPTVIEVAKDTSPVKTLIQKMVSSYNDLLAEYQSDTQSSTDASQRGVLNSDLTLSTIMRQITESFSLEIKRLDGSSIGKHNDLSVLGLEFDTNGKLVFKESLFNASSQLPGLLEQGIKIGYKSATQDLSQTLASVLSDSGSLSDRIAEEKHTQTDLNKRKTQMQEKLVTLQERYTAQYAALDALLFQLNNTNNALKSALDGLTNSQKNN